MTATTSPATIRHARMVAPYIIDPSDIHHVAKGGPIKELPARNRTAGALHDGLAYTLTKAGIDVTHSVHGPGFVPWPVIVDIILVGTANEELVAAVTEAQGAYVEAAVAQQEYLKTNPWRPKARGMSPESAALSKAASDAHRRLSEATRAFVTAALDRDNLDAQLELDLAEWLEEQP